MGEITVPTEADRIATRELAASIVESVKNDEEMPLPAALFPRRGAIEVEDVERFVFNLALEIVALQEDERSRIRRVGGLLVAQSGAVTVDVEELNRVYLLGVEHGRAQGGALDANETRALRAIMMVDTLTTGGALDIKVLVRIFGLAKVIAEHWRTQEGVNGELLDQLVDAFKP